MKLIIGLGNPEVRYVKTRHNIGRRVIEALARKFKVHWQEGKSFHSRWAEANQDKLSFLLAVPNLFMNESGRAVQSLVAHFKIDFRRDLLIVVDDAALPFGKLRLRASGTDGGHRGLRSVEEILGSRDYARLRVGIAPLEPVGVPLEEYVLSPFERAEEQALRSVLERCVESCRRWLAGSIEKAMDYTNKPSERAT